MKMGSHLPFSPEGCSSHCSGKIPTMYFVDSMSDLFHEVIPDSYLEEVFSVMRRAPQHTFQVLTKQAERMVFKFMKSHDAPKNLWLGVTVENRPHGLLRIPLLRQVDAHLRFLSVEPLLEDLGNFDLAGIHWVIVGGESGPSGRKMEPKWVLRVKSQCDRAKVPFFFKQWGTWGPDGMKRSKKANGRVLNGHTWDDMS